MMVTVHTGNHPANSLNSGMYEVVLRQLLPQTLLCLPHIASRTSASLGTQCSLCTAWGRAEWCRTLIQASEL